jgi:mRNA-degrading endonuclease RelE of RelBE toxin-antitoxin system
MAEYRITFASSAARELTRLDPPVARRVLAAIEAPTKPYAAFDR